MTQAVAKQPGSTARRHIISVRLSATAGLLVASMGAAVSLGWIVKALAWPELAEPIISMRIHTALGLAFLGMALWLSLRTAEEADALESKQVLSWQKVLVWATICLSLVTLIERATGTIFGIDLLFLAVFSEP